MNIDKDNASDNSEMIQDNKNCSDDVMEITAVLADDAFEVSEKKSDKLNLQVKLSLSLKLGLIIIIISFVMSLVISPLLVLFIGNLMGSAEGIKWGGICYGASWIVMAIGFVIGGRGAKQIVMDWKVKFKNKIKKGIWRTKKTQN